MHTMLILMQPNLTRRNRRTKFTRVQLRALMEELKDNKPHGPGRPRLQIDPVRVEQLACAGLSVAEISAQFHCDPQTIRNNFSVEIEQGRLRLAGTLRRKAVSLALVHDNWLALRFLLRTVVGMDDRVPVTSTLTVNTNLSELESLSDEELAERLRKLQAELAVLTSNGNCE